MSLIVTLYVPEGIVLAGDSRLTLNWSSHVNNIERSHSISASDTNNKIFVINDKFGLGIFGSAAINGIPLAGFINQFVEQLIKESTTIDEMPQLLHDFFGAPFGFPGINFYIIGYKIEHNISVPYAYFINIANKSSNRINYVNDKIINGANWGGEIEVLSRILNPVKVNNNGTWLDLNTSPIPWNYMTLQDAVDFSVYAIRTTMETMKFQQKEKTVGGPIDILVIKPNKIPIWVAKKELKLE
jgi:hypothetical protein